MANITHVRVCDAGKVLGGGGGGWSTYSAPPPTARTEGDGFSKLLSPPPKSKVGNELPAISSWDDENAGKPFKFHF